jgi:hypothetical protein
LYAAQLSVGTVTYMPSPSIVIPKLRRRNELHQVCTGCGTMYEPHTDKTSGCTVCTRFASLISNAQRVRRDGRIPGVEITLGEFANWVRTRSLRCDYCHVPEHLIQYLGIRTQVDQPLSRLGVDRVSTEFPYRLSNIVLCCFACNKAKSNTFSSDEMSAVGEAIAKVWQSRLAKAGVEWERVTSE